MPAAADQLIVVSSATYDPPGYLATLRTFSRTNAFSPWRPVFPVWQAETGYGHLKDVRHEGDGSTPTGTFPIGPTMYGNSANPGGLRYAYHHLICGDWWDEDPYSSQYNRFVHVSCGTTPSFASWSEALWTEVQAYPYFTVIQTNNDPIVSGTGAPGSGIFLHNWVNGPTAGCVALPETDLLAVLRWLDPARHPVIEIGTNAEVGTVPPEAPAQRWSVANDGSGANYWLASSGGVVAPFGTARWLGEPDRSAGPTLAAPVVGAAALPARLGQGYWVVTAVGEVFAFGAARSYGSVPAAVLRRSRSRVVGMAATRDGRGYWVALSGGGVFGIGDARRFGVRPSLGRAIAIAGDPRGRAGYWILYRDGAVSAIGAARFVGSPRSEHRPAGSRPVGLLATANGRGYWVALADGGVLPFGDAKFLGSAVHDRLSGPIAGITAFSGGYALYAVPVSLPAHPHQYQFPAR